MAVKNYTFIMKIIATIELLFNIYLLVFLTQTRYQMTEIVCAS